MSDGLDELGKLLDRLLPFLDSSPPWLKIWVYVLVVLNFVTIGAVSVSYLVNKQPWHPAITSDDFTIDSPKPDDLIGLSETNTWSVAGKFPVIPADRNPQKAVKLDILHLPGGEEVPQQGLAQITTEGRWLFNSAKFLGAGSYKIVATATLGDRTDSRSVQIRCTDTASAYRQSIDDARKQRGAPPIAWKEEGKALQQVESQLRNLEKRFEQQYFIEHDLPAVFGDGQSGAKPD